MLPSFESVDFSQYSVEQRLALIGRIWDTFEDAPVQLSLSECEELERRVLAEQQAGDQGVTWANLKKRVQGLP